MTPMLRVAFLVLCSLSLLTIRVEPHGEGAFGIGKARHATRLELKSARQVEDWLNQRFRPSFGIGPAQDLRAQAAEAPRYPELGQAVLARGDGRGVLVAYDRPMRTAGVDIYDTHHRYHVVYQVMRAIAGKEPPSGKPAFVLDLEGLYPGVLEMSDLHLVDDRLYVNIGINGYASVLGGKTGYVACIDTRAGKLVWRTGPLVTNAPMRIVGDDLITGYGFTAEPDYLHVLDRETGATVDRVKVPNAMEDLEADGDTLYVKTYDRYMVFDIAHESG